MKKIILLPVCLLLCISNIQAQSSGTLLLGANILTSSVNSFDANAVHEQNLQARIGYFASKRLAIGLCLEAGINNNESVPYGLTLFSRWYSGHKPQQTIKFFMEAGAGIADNTHTKGEEMLSYSSKKWMRTTASLSAGINIFPARWVALELAPEYRHITGTHALNRLGLNAGVKIFLSEQVFKKTFPDKFKSLY